LIVGAVANPTQWHRWNEAKAYLEPARARGDFKDVIEPDEALYVVLDGDELLGCATAWLSTDGYVEVKLVGGKDHRRWIAQLDEAIGAAAKRAEARKLLAIGRRGWMRSIQRLGWVKHSETDDQWVFAKEL
jgi:hypothetical protein